MLRSPLLQQVERTWVLCDGRKLSYFGGSDYFRLASHPEVLSAAEKGLRTYGLNVAASRLTTGNHRLYHELEQRIAEFFGAPAAALVSSGYLAGSAAAQALAGEFSHVFIDRQAHPCLKQAAPLFGAPIIHFHRADAADLRRRVRSVRRGGRVVVMSEGVFGHSGELAPLREYLAVLPRTAMLFIDDAHGGGTLGATGKGIVEELELPLARVIRTVTLSKAMGVYGGAVLGTRALQQRVYAASLVFVGNTPLPLPLAAAAIKSVSILQKDRGLRNRLRENTARVKEAWRATGLPAGHGTAPIVSVAPGDHRRAAALRNRLLDRGIFPSFIRYPGGPPEGYYRFAISSEHSAEQLDALVAALAEDLAQA